MAIARSNLSKLLESEINENTSIRSLKFNKIQESLNKKISGINNEFTSDLGNLVGGIFEDAGTASIDELKIKAKRLENIKKYIEASPRQVKEFQKLNKTLTEAQEAILSELTLKNRIMKGTASFISNNSVDMTALLVAMVKDDPILGFAMKFVGDKFSAWRERKKELRQTTKNELKEDALSIKESLEKSKLKPKDPVLEQKTRNLINNEETLTDTKLLGLAITEMSDSVKEINENVSKLVRFKEQELQEIKKNELENLENQTEFNRSAKNLGKSQFYKKDLSSKGNKGLFGKVQNFFSGDFLGDFLGSYLGASFAKIGIGGLLRKSLGLLLTPTKLISKLLLPVQLIFDGVMGYFSAEKWGVGSTSAIIGGLLGGTFNDKILNTFANSGKWGMAGAMAGSAIMPGPGTIVGGTIGALLGGVLGYMGGERIAKYGEAIGNKLFSAFNAIWEWFGGIFKTIGEKVEGIPGMKQASSYLKDLGNLVAIDDDFYRGLNVIGDVVSGAASEAYGNFQAKLKKGKSNFRRAKGFIDSNIESMDEAILGNNQNLTRKKPVDVPADMFGINFKSYAQKIAEKESSNNYTAVNRYNYLGRYQMGADALIDSGLVKKTAKGNNRKLNNPEYWNNGLSKEEFLKNPELQDYAFTQYTKRNYTTLINQGLISSSDNKESVAGKLMASHLVGPGAVKSYINNGQITKDANGTSVASYMEFGKSSQSAPIMAMEIPKTTIPNITPKVQTNTNKARELSEKTSITKKQNNIINDNKVINNVVSSGNSSGPSNPKGPSYTSTAGIDFSPATGGSMF